MLVRLQAIVGIAFARKVLSEMSQRELEAVPPSPDNASALGSTVTVARIKILSWMMKHRLSLYVLVLLCSSNVMLMTIIMLYVHLTCTYPTCGCASLRCGDMSEHTGIKRAGRSSTRAFETTGMFTSPVYPRFKTC